MGVPYAEVIGDPIAHSKSPLIHKFWLEKLGIEGDYRATRVAADELNDYFKARRADPDWRGCNVTMPHKRAVSACLDRIDSSVKWAGSVNCVSWERDALIGCNTDGSGIAVAIEDAHLEFAAVAVVGSGAAARTAWSCMDSEGVSETRIVARDAAQAGRILAAPKMTGMKGRHVPIESVQDAFSDVALILNATPLGMTGFSAMPDLILEAVRHSRIDALVADMVYDPLQTALLSVARSFGRKTSDGLTMLIGQARDSFGHFFPADPPSGDSALRALLTS